MERQPGFIHEFSKENSQPERDQMAYAIRQARSFNREITPVHERVKQRKQELEQLEKQIELLSEPGFINFIRNFFELRAARAQAKELNSHFSTAKEQLEELELKQQELQANLAETGINLDTPQHMLNAFYSHQKELWAQSEHTEEDIHEHMNEEKLASLSLEDYATLWRRFPRNYVTHATRQGIRDHTGHGDHTAGLDEFHSGLTAMLEDMRIDSPLTAAITDQEKKAWIIAALRLNTKKSREDALRALDVYLNPDLQGFGTFADRAAIHFAAQEVADGYYGGERGNEVFLVYPGAFIATHFYKGPVNQPESKRYDDRNDIWVWKQENQGIDINAGIVFLPAHAQVDPRSGSKYEIRDGKAVIHEAHRSHLLELFHREDFLVFAHTHADRYQSPELAQEIEETFAMEPTLARAVARHLYRVRSAQSYSETERREREFSTVTTDILRAENIYYKKVENTISSRDYWEGYFSEHPEQRPNKIVYYEANDPTNALRQWLDDNKIIRQQPVDPEGSHVRYDHNPEHMREVLQQQGETVDRFLTIATAVIEEYFPYTGETVESQIPS